MGFDLFDRPGEVREKCGKVRNDRRTSSQAPREKGKCGKPHFPFTDVRESADALPFLLRAGAGRASGEGGVKDRASKIRDAMLRRMDLQTALADAAQAERETAAVLAPYDVAFQEAHAVLSRAVEHEPDRRVRLAAYDARVIAGHARHPFKERWREAARWRKEVETELRALNVELERMGG